MTLPDSDRSLVHRLRDDPAALERIYEENFDRVLAFARSRCRDPQDAADLVAATFVAAIESSGRYDPDRGEVLPWLLGIASRLWANGARSAARERRALLRLLGEARLEPDELGRAEERLDAARESAAIEEALAELEPGGREAVRLLGEEGLSQAEAARRLGIGPTAFRMRLSRARRSLRRALDRTSLDPYPIPPRRPEDDFDRRR